MQKLLKWTLDTIREKESAFSWMEEHRFAWAPLVNSAVSQILEGKTVLVMTDESRQWFGKYILQKVNDLEKHRPLLPFYPLGGCFPHLYTVKSKEDIQLLEDMLDISYPNGYYIWYIGKGDHAATKVAYRNDDNFLWLMDEEAQNSFHLRSSDPLLDIKLLQLYRLFDETLSAALFGDLDIEL
ncbi:HobA family DNA replication regulator [Sulfurovum mangrovi]|uniref:HobA family DNA replication regulator n=1 Tax=Sulfurovum mangrovi TaxID=2893889 RepID=UPI001E4C9792|nr:HobA family DNA replication regulator [Sulfurovum mangrovi]UFH59690.1 HobA family DNA replication regulator [Sulfurovum mangrovi]UFH60835.1 HobA family DNA replication regulator [Sulfurovum mangrovi]